MYGTVKVWLEDRGFGFITGDDGKDVFVHARALPRGVRTLKQGSRVRYGLTSTARGTAATDVQLLEDDESEEWADVITEEQYRRELTAAAGTQDSWPFIIQIAKSHGWIA